MKKFLISLLLFLSPILVLLTIYVVTDPFKTLHHYENFYTTTNEQYIMPVIGVDRDYISTELFIQNYKKYKYDSYIFGSSRSTTYFFSEWKKYVKGEGYFHFDASGETLYGIERKISYIKNIGAPMKNALIVMDPPTIASVDNELERLKLKHYKLTGMKYTDFQNVFLRDFFDPQFLPAFLDYTFSGKIKPYMVKNEIFNSGAIKSRYDLETNEIGFHSLDTMIAHNKEKYYREREHIFYPRSKELHYYPKAVGDSSAQMLRRIKAAFDNSHTSYKIVIGPAYDQEKLDTTDMKFLQDLFGAENVFDFSGINEFTNDKYNYYENSHYLPSISARIMNIIYGGHAQDSIAKIFGH